MSAGFVSSLAAADLFDRPLIVYGPVADDETTRRILTCLSPAEQARAERFHFAVDRAAYGSAHFLLRTCLTVLAGHRDWDFAQGDHGKPELCPPWGSPPLSFNISHSRTTVACALTSGRQIGVDTEDAYQGSDMMSLAARIFSCEEFSALCRAEAGSRPSVFSSLWTAKEAIAKACGLGLSLDLRNWSIDVNSGMLDLGSSILGKPSAWRLDRRVVGTTHMTVAVHSAPGLRDPAGFSWHRVDIGELASSLAFSVRSGLPDKPAHGVTE